MNQIRHLVGLRNTHGGDTGNSTYALSRFEATQRHFHGESRHKSICQGLNNGSNDISIELG